MMLNNNSKRIHALFEELVPMKGKCDSLAGELVRAVSKIGYRLYNDGDHIGVGYGNETCNQPARFLRTNGNPLIFALIEGMWGMKNEDAYEQLLDALEGAVADMIEADPSLREKATDDMLDKKYSSADDEYIDDEEDDDYDDEEDEDDEED